MVGNRVGLGLGFRIVVQEKWLRLLLKKLKQIGILNSNE